MILVGFLLNHHKLYELLAVNFTLKMKEIFNVLMEDEDLIQENN